MPSGFSLPVFEVLFWFWGSIPSPRLILLVKLSSWSALAGDEAFELRKYDDKTIKNIMEQRTRTLFLVIDLNLFLFDNKLSSFKKNL